MTGKQAGAAWRRSISADLLLPMPFLWERETDHTIQFLRGNPESCHMVKILDANQTTALALANIIMVSLETGNRSNCVKIKKRRCKYKLGGFIRYPGNRLYVRPDF
ncbi:hypothetical protein ACHQM5_018601 [Ranunculus cassubicifolius]